MSHARHPLFRRWTGIRQVLLNPNDPSYPNLSHLDCHGLDDFAVFVDMVQGEIGLPQGQRKYLNRVDQNRGWVSGNLEWRTGKEVARNKKSNIILKFRRKSRTLAEWSEITGINHATLSSRIERGWSVKDILTVKEDYANNVWLGQLKRYK